MSAADLFESYVAEHRAGGDADPASYMRRAAPGERRELAALIDAYLEQAPRERFDESAYRGSSSEATVAALERSLAGQAGLWPALLPRLRDRAGLKRRELVERLAAALGLQGREAKVGAYYHEMEQGILPAAGVSARVLDALGAIVGTSAEELREAGLSLGAGPLPGAGGVSAFARAVSAERFAVAADGVQSAPEAAAQAPPSGGEWDEVDELFRGNQA